MNLCNVYAFCNENMLMLLYNDSCILGSLLFYCFMQIAVLWILHVSVIFWNVRFPDQYMLLNRRHQVKYIHLVSVLVAIVVPVIPVAVIYGTGGFVNGRFPPLLCLPSNANAAFYSLVLPVSVLIASGVTLLLAVFWTLHKVSVFYMHAYTAKYAPPNLTNVFCASKFWAVKKISHL